MERPRTAEDVARVLSRRRKLTVFSVWARRIAIMAFVVALLLCLIFLHIRMTALEETYKQGMPPGFWEGDNRVSDTQERVSGADD